MSVLLVAALALPVGFGLEQLYQIGPFSAVEIAIVVLFFFRRGWRHVTPFGVAWLGFLAVAGIASVPNGVLDVLLDLKRPTLYALIALAYAHSPLEDDKFRLGVILGAVTFAMILGALLVLLDRGDAIVDLYASLSRGLGGTYLNNIHALAVGTLYVVSTRDHLDTAAVALLIVFFTAAVVMASNAALFGMLFALLVMLTRRIEGARYVLAVLSIVGAAALVACITLASVTSETNSAWIGRSELIPASVRARLRAYMQIMNPAATWFRGLVGHGLGSRFSLPWTRRFAATNLSSPTLSSGALFLDGLYFTVALKIGFVGLLAMLLTTLLCLRRIAEWKSPMMQSAAYAVAAYLAVTSVVSSYLFWSDTGYFIVMCVVAVWGGRRHPGHSVRDHRPPSRPIDQGGATLANS